ncbi:MAG TPA: glycosyltransferase family 87 protein [Nocardioides sp.]|nr:glycosyltransferase family 87 protein [Nocardioides sp.]
MIDRLLDHRRFPARLFDSGWRTWFLTRLVMVAVMLPFTDHGVIGDLQYYLRTFRHFGDLGWQGSLSEYPVPAVLILIAPFAVLSVLGLGGATLYVWIAIMLGTDALVMRILRRSGSESAPVLWLVAIPALGPLVYCRFDLLPGLFVGLAIMASERSGKRAGVYASIATALKYSPVLIVPALAAARWSRKQVLITVAVVGGLLMGLTWLLGGTDRVMSPLRYQNDRGLQIESVWATVVMLVRSVYNGRYSVGQAPSHSVEIAGPGVGTSLFVSKVATVAMIALLVWLWVRAWRAATPATNRLVWLSLSGVMAFIVSGKVLSPQYLAWLLPAAIIGVALLAGEERRHLRRWAILLIVTCAVTHVVYPYAYTPLVHYSWGTPIMTAVLGVRNLLLMILAGMAFAEGFRTTKLLPRLVVDSELSAVVPGIPGLAGHGGDQVAEAADEGRDQEPADHGVHGDTAQQ